MNLLKIIKNKNIYKYIFLFIIIMLFNLFYIYTFYDGIAQYAMSRAISLGEIPYEDFNTVSTPLFIFIHSIFLNIYDSYLTFTIVNSIFLLLIYYFCSKICPKYSFTIMLLLCLPFVPPYFIAPSYNLLAYLLIIMIMYFEKEKKSDFLIGLLIGLLILTKHTVGISIMICSFIYIRDFKKILNRLKGLIIPLIIFLIYLVFTKSLYDCIDLIVLGLFDFGTKNTKYSPIVLIMSLLLVSYYIWNIIKNKNKDNNYLTYYALGSLSLVIPIFDLNHIMGSIFFFLIIIFTKYDIKLNVKLFNAVVATMIIIITCYFGSTLHFSSFNHYPYLLSSSDDYKRMNDVIYFYKTKYPNSKMVSPSAPLYDTIADKRITYFDLTLTGNYGHLGTQKIINMLENDTYYFIYKNYNGNEISQFDTKLCEHIIKNSKLVDEIGEYNIYHYIEKS